MWCFIKKTRFLFIFLTTLLFGLVTAIDAELGLHQVADGFFAILLVMGIFAISGNKKKFFVWMIMLVGIKAMHLVLKMYLDEHWINAFRAGVAMSFFFIMMVECLCLVLKDKAINMATLFGSMSAYLFMGMGFAYLYLVFFAINPSLFSGFSSYPEPRAIYFSFITLTTVGYGDVLTLNPLLQTISWIESFLGHAYMALFISQLVGRYVAFNIEEGLKDKR